MRLKLGILATAILFGGQLSLPAAALQSGDEYSDLTISRNDRGGFAFDYNVAGIESRRMTSAQAEKRFIEIENCTYTNQPGMPQLPVRIVVIGVPPESDLRVSYSYTIGGPDLSGVEFPLAPERGRDEFSAEPRLNSQSGGMYPAELVEVEGPMFIRSQKIARLKIYPVQYDPATRSSIFYNQITVRVEFQAGNGSYQIYQGKENFDHIFRESLANYSVAKDWRVDSTPTTAVVPDDPFAYSNNWYKLAVDQDGLYRLTAAQLQSAGINVGSIDPRTFRIFNGGGKVLPVSNFLPRPDLKELSISIPGEQDGTLDAGDQILFYGQAVNRWDYDSSADRYKFLNNPYTNQNVYWLTWGGGFATPPKRWIAKDGSVTTYDQTVTNFREKLHVEQDLILFQLSDGSISDYFNWYWIKQSGFTFSPTLKNAITSDTAEIRFSSNTISPLPNSMLINGVLHTSITRDGAAAVVKTLAQQNGVNQLQVFYPSQIYLDFYEVVYPRLLDASENQLWFDNPRFSGTVRYDINNFNLSSYYLLDITDHFDTRPIQNGSVAGNILSFQDGSADSTESNYLLVSSSLLKTPALIQPAMKPDLRDIVSAANQADLTIIAPNIFLGSLTEISTFHQLENNLRVKVVSAEDIYNHFSWGLFDPVAIRDFLKYSFENWAAPAPAWCLLVGDASYDYKDIQNTGAVNYIPSFAQQVNACDDNYVFFGNIGYYDSDSSLGMDRGLDMVISRWPAKTATDIQTISRKIIDYQTEPELGSWKNLITLVADDEFNPDNNLDNEDLHTVFTEEVANLFTPKIFNLAKIYAIEYPFDVSRRKPSCEEAIVNRINQGTVLVNYMGHGNPDVWSHENLFIRTSDLPRLTNTRRLPLISTFSCSIGFFDSPHSEGMGEEFLRSSGGAISVVAATRAVFALSNKILNDNFLARLLNNDSLPIAEALYLTKLMRQPNSNDRHYEAFGDPLLALGIPQLQAEITATSSDTLKAGELFTFQGQINDRLGTFQSAYNGQLEVQVFDTERSKTYSMPSGGDINYKSPGAMLFRGKLPVQSGQFQGAFIVPKDISYGSGNARISLYVFNSAFQDGRGIKDSIAIAGSPGGFSDFTGPEIEINFIGQPHPRENDLTDPQPTLSVNLSDSGGINLAGGLGHDITITLDQNQVFVVTDSFQYNPGEYQSGSFAYQLPQLDAGQHQISVKAWDSFNNSSLEELTFQVANLSQLAITDVMNYPNPFQDVTNFTYQLSQAADQVDIKIYTLSGRLIKHISNASAQPGYNYSTSWDGRDRDGDRVASGVYIYKISVKGEVFQQGGTQSAENEVLGKLVYQR